MSFEVHAQGSVHVFDCFSCAIHRMAPICEHCRVQIIGQGVEVEGQWYCGAHCARAEEGGHRRPRVTLLSLLSLPPLPTPDGHPAAGVFPAGGTVVGVYRFVLTRQWVCLTLIALALIPAMIKLGFWQYHRHEHRVAQNELIAANLSAKPVPMTEVTSPDTRSRGPISGAPSPPPARTTPRTRSSSGCARTTTTRSASTS